MKRKILFGTSVFFLLFTVACDNPSSPPKGSEINQSAPIVEANIVVTAPVEGAVPNSIATAAGNFSIGEVSWNPDHSYFQNDIMYTATVMLTANTNFTFTGGLTGTVSINGNAVMSTIANDGRTAILSHTFGTNPPVPLNIEVPSDLTYSNNHNINGIFRNAITPIQYGSYSERTASFTVPVSGFINDSDAYNVWLVMQAVDGLSFSGYNMTGNASSGVKTFTITVTLLDTMSFDTGSAIITITGLSDLTGTGYVYYNGNVNTTVNIIDGRTENRAIPINQANIRAFNFYARTTNGLGRHYKLMENILLPMVDPDTGNNWTAIGSPLSPFTGSFDGQGYTISNLTINQSWSYQGMFGFLGGGWGLDALVRNLGLLDVSINGGQRVGGIAGILINGSRIINCFVMGNVSGTLGVGGVAGVIENISSIINCFASGYIRGIEGVGGVVGTVRISSIVTNSFATGNVSGTSIGVGGVAGIVTNYSSIINSYAVSDVNGPVGIGGVAGIVGGGLGRSSITNSYATGNVSGYAEVGGVVGRISNANIVNSVALNSMITRTGWTDTRFGRVGGSTAPLLHSFTLSGNYANSEMIASGNISFPENEFHAAGLNGVDVNLANSQTQAWWENTAGFNFGTSSNYPWQWCTINLRPKLHWE